MSLPLVSIITPTYNRQTIKSAIGSALRPCGVPVEHIVVDDCSSSDHWHFLLDVAQNFQGQVQVLRTPVNSGPGTARNMGLAQSRAKYVFFLDSDDIFAPDALAHLVREAEMHQSDIVIPLAVRADNHIHGGFSSSDSCSAKPFAQCAAIRDLGPCKLFNRQFLLNHALTFPHDRYFGEDQVFMLKAYLSTPRISIIAHEIGLFLGASADSLTAAPKIGDILHTMHEVMVFANQLPPSDVNRLLILKRIFNADMRFVLGLLQKSGQSGEFDLYIRDQILPLLDDVGRNFVDDEVKMVLARRLAALAR